MTQLETIIEHAPSVLEIRDMLIKDFSSVPYLFDLQRRIAPAFRGYPRLGDILQQHYGITTSDDRVMAALLVHRLASEFRKDTGAPSMKDEAFGMYITNSAERNQLVRLRTQETTLVWIGLDKIMSHTAAVLNGYIGMFTNLTESVPENVQITNTSIPFSDLVSYMHSKSDVLMPPYLYTGAGDNKKDSEAVKIIDGPFSDFLGTIDAIDEARGKIKVLVSIFGRETPVELDFLQVTKL